MNKKQRWTDHRRKKTCDKQQKLSTATKSWDHTPLHPVAHRMPNRTHPASHSTDNMPSAGGGYFSNPLEVLHTNAQQSWTHTKKPLTRRRINQTRRLTASTGMHLATVTAQTINRGVHPYANNPSKLLAHKKNASADFTAHLVLVTMVAAHCLRNKRTSAGQRLTGL